MAGAGAKEEKRQQMERRERERLGRCVSADDNGLFASWTGRDATASLLKLKAQIFLTGGAGRSLAVRRRKWDLNKSGLLLWMAG